VTDDELREQLALYAVGALDDDERTELEDVLRTRPDLRAELDDLLAAAAMMADIEREDPPAGLRASVLDLIANQPQLPAEPLVPAAPIAPVVPIMRKRYRWIAAGAAVVAAAAIAVGVVVVTRDDGGTDKVAAVVEADDAQTIQMPGTGEAGSLPGVTIVHSPSENAAVILADQVPVPEGDRVYELWAINDNVPQRYATFRPDESGRLSVYAAGLDPASADVWAITEEPAGGSDTPTPPILNATA
jgi:anti-sigma-K factor RskA